MLKPCCAFPARQEALLCERARESDVRVTSVVRVHVCGAELCAHTATEAFGLMAPAMETRINGGYANTQNLEDNNTKT
jgi:hypothetical protein